MTFRKITEQDKAPNKGDRLRKEYVTLSHFATILSHILSFCYSTGAFLAFKGLLLPE